MSKKNNYRNKIKINDYVIFCDICAMKCWHSESKILHKYTGHGNAIVCPNCVDSIDYGLVPYKVRPEKSPEITRNNHYASNPQDVPEGRNPVDPSTFNPLAGYLSYTDWDDITDVTWGTWWTPWGE